MGLVGKCSQFFFEVGIVGQVTFTTPVVILCRLVGEIPDLRFECANEFVHLAADELLVFDNVLSDVWEASSQIN